MQTKYMAAILAVFCAFNLYLWDDDVEVDPDLVPLYIGRKVARNRAIIEEFSPRAWQAYGLLPLAYAGLGWCYDILVKVMRIQGRHEHYQVEILDILVILGGIFGWWIGSFGLMIQSVGAAGLLVRAANLAYDAYLDLGGPRWNF